MMDLFFTIGTISDSEAIINFVNEVKFDVAVLGNHEFDLKNRIYWCSKSFNFYQKLYINYKR